MKSASKYKLNKGNKILIIPLFWIFIWMLSRCFIRSDVDLNSIETLLSTSPTPEDDIEISLRPPHVLSSAPMQRNAFNFNSSKKILYFNNYFHLTDWRFGFGNSPFISNGCPQTNCYVTNDRKMLGSLADFDAILFHARDMDKRVIQVPSQERRKSNQRYVFFLMESPLNDGLNYTNKRFHDFFNWTMTYRMDSDIPRPYGWFSEKNSLQFYPPADHKWIQPKPLTEVQKKNHAHPKKKLVAWMVSNCNTHSNREDYVELLKKYIPVDVFGACGKHKCAKIEDHNSEECDHLLENDYKFYLSFENSFCSGYVTEKFYKAFTLDIVPVVMGGADYKNKAPPKSYIDVLDFESPKQLAEFLLALNDDDEEYMSYFWWKDHYKVHNSEKERSAQAMCKLCEKLNEADVDRKSYPTLGAWWWGEGHCTKKGHVPWARPKSNWGEKILSLFPSG